MSKQEKRNIVYSTNPDWSKQKSGEREEGAANNNVSNTAYIQRDRKKRAGKIVTVISKLNGDLKSLQKELQKHCGAGGSVKRGNIEIQGDQRDKIAEYLKQKGYKVKFAGE